MDEAKANKKAKADGGLLTREKSSKTSMSW